MDRRAFLRRLGFGTLGAAAAALTFDVENLLWVAGEKTIFIPPVVVPAMGNTFITPLWVTRDVALNFKNAIKFSQRIDMAYGRSPIRDEFVVRVSH